MGTFYIADCRRDMGSSVHIPNTGCGLQKIRGQEGTAPKWVMDDSTRDERVWKEIIGVTWEAPERTFYELPAETKEEKSQPPSD